MIHFYAQSIRSGMRMVRIELSLHRFVGANTADVGFQQKIFPLGSAATGEDARNLRGQGLVVRLSRFSSREAAIRHQVRPLNRAAKRLPLVLEQTSEEHP